MTDADQAAHNAESVRNEFYVELTSLLNRHSVENGSDTPDYILARYLMGCLDTFERAVRQRDSWYQSVKPIWDATTPVAHNDGST